MGAVVHVHPNMIVVEANVRSETDLLREFVGSTKQNGVVSDPRSPRRLGRRDCAGRLEPHPRRPES